MSFQDGAKIAEEGLQSLWHQTLQGSFSVPKIKRGAEDEEHAREPVKGRPTGRRQRNRDGTGVYFQFAGDKKVC